MGRRKITIRQITDPKLRHITFNKRKNGLIKKAAELSLLCNVNMLLVFEDGAGNLIQFSKNKINNINGFFQECKYNTIIELTAKEYPHFFKVNHYKKTKDQDKSNHEDEGTEINNNQEFYSLATGDMKQEHSKNQVKDVKSKENGAKKVPQPSVNQFIPPQTKAEVMNFSESDRMNLMAVDNRPTQDTATSNSKPKSKQDLRLNIMKSEDANKQPKMSSNNENIGKMPLAPGDLNEAAYNSYNNFKKDAYQDEQLKQIEKNGDYTASTFITPNMDPMKRLSGAPDPMNSPFNFYPGNGRLRPFGNFGLNPFSNEEAQMLKSYSSSYGFPMGGNPSFMGKMPPNGEIDDKFIDTAKMLNYLNQAGMNPLNRQNMFGFSPNDYPKMAVNDVMRQVNNRSESDQHNGRIEESRDELNTMYKGDPRFDQGLPSANLSGRRYNNFDGFFNTFEEDYGGGGGEKQKKLKHN